MPVGLGSRSVAWIEDEFEVLDTSTPGAAGGRRRLCDAMYFVAASLNVIDLLQTLRRTRRTPARERIDSVVKIGAPGVVGNLRNPPRFAGVMPSAVGASSRLMSAPVLPRSRV